MFISSVGFSVDVHICKGEVTSVSFFGEAEACEMSQEISGKSNIHPCCKARQEEKRLGSKENTVLKNQCCHNEQLSLETNPNITTPTENVEMSDLTFIILFALDYYTLFSVESSVDDFQNYSPPLLGWDMPVLNQVFRI